LAHAQTLKVAFHPWETAMTSRDEGLRRLWPMIRDIRVAMLSTWNGDHLRSRPMQAHLDEDGGQLYFFTRLDSGKTREARRYDEVNVAFADNAGQSWVSISGRAHIELDTDTIRRFWTPFAAAWFPEGLDDPELALLRIEPEVAEYWDMTASSMRYLWEISKANITGEQPAIGETGRIEMASRH
jgi:general stress protein 26